MFLVMQQQLESELVEGQKSTRQANTVVSRLESQLSLPRLTILADEEGIARGGFAQFV